MASLSLPAVRVWRTPLTALVCGARAPPRRRPPLWSDTARAPWRPRPLRSTASSSATAGSAPPRRQASSAVPVSSWRAHARTPPPPHEGRTAADGGGGGGGGGVTGAGQRSSARQNRLRNATAILAIAVPLTGVFGLFVRMHADADVRDRVEAIVPGSVRLLQRVTGKEYDAGVGAASSSAKPGPSTDAAAATMTGGVGNAQGDAAASKSASDAASARGEQQEQREQFGLHEIESMQSAASLGSGGASEFDKDTDSAVDGFGVDARNFDYDRYFSAPDGDNGDGDEGGASGSAAGNRAVDRDGTDADAYAHAARQRPGVTALPPVSNENLPPSILDMQQELAGLQRTQAPEHERDTRLDGERVADSGREQQHAHRLQAFAHEHRQEPAHGTRQVPAHAHRVDALANDETSAHDAQRPSSDAGNGGDGVAPSGASGDSSASHSPSTDDAQSSTQLRTDSSGGGDGAQQLAPVPEARTHQDAGAGAPSLLDTSDDAPAQPASALIRHLAGELDALVHREAVRLFKLMPSPSTASTASETQDTESRRRAAVQVLQREGELRRDLEHYLADVRRQMLREAELTALERAKQILARQATEREESLRTSLTEEYSAKVSALRDEHLRKLQELQAVAAVVEQSYGHDREYKLVSHWTHRVAIMWRALADKAARGEPFRVEYDTVVRAWNDGNPLREAGEHDAHWAESSDAVLAVLHSVPRDVVDRGAATRDALRARFLTSVFREGRIASLMKEDSGVLGYVLARIAAALKFDDHDAPYDEGATGAAGERDGRDGQTRGAGTGASPSLLSLESLLSSAMSSSSEEEEEEEEEEKKKKDTPVTPIVSRGNAAEKRYLRARAHLLHGDLRDAVAELERIEPGTIAGRICADWLLDARRRLALEQAARVCESESIALAAALY